MEEKRILTIYIREKDRKEIARFAKEYGLSLSSAINYLIKKGLKEEMKNESKEN